VFTFGELFGYLPTASNSRADLGNTGAVAYVHYGDIHTRFHHFVDFSRDDIPRLLPGKSVTAARLRDGDLIVADASEDEAGVGKSVEVRNLGATEAVSGLHTLLLRSKDQRVRDGYRGYLLEMVPAKVQLRRLATGLKVFGISKRALKDVRVPLPLLGEQRAIAEALSDVDGLLAALEALIAKKRAIKQATMQQLLTGRTRLPGFSGAWETKRLGDTGQCLPTANNPRAELRVDGDLEYIHYGDVHAHPGPVLDCSRTILPRIGQSRVGNAVEVQDGDLVMVDASEDLAGLGKSVEMKGTVGRTVVAGLHTILFRGQPSHWALGYKAYLQFVPALRSALTRVASGISVYAVSASQLGDFALLLPSVPEQGAIVTVLSDMDAEIEALERRRDKTRAIKQGMVQQLLAGRIRLVKPGEVQTAT
jgi:type I restriction enzyme S subunit